ncbi:MAG: aspartate aminotransferase family protein [Acidimicrobiales bacterium]
MGPAPAALLQPFAKPATSDSIKLVRSEGVRVYDEAGKDYIDGLGSLWYCQVGHGRRELIDAITNQLDTMATYNIFSPFTSDVAEAAADRIASVAPFPDARVFLCSSGSESIDTALKIARLVAALRDDPDRQIIVRRTRGYHGVNVGGTSVQGIAPNRENYGDLLPHVVEIDPDDIESAARLFAEHGDRIAAVVSEPVQGAGGVFTPVDGYLERLRDLCTKHGALLIFDEVICGFGRTGNWFAAQTYGVEPDLITFAKGVTSGYQPMGGVLVNRSVADLLEADPEFLFRHGYTYSGHPAACAAAIANIDVIEHDGLVARANAIGERLTAGIGSLIGDGLVAELRGVGAVWAARLPDGTDYARSSAVRDAMLERGVIARPIGDVIAFCPPLVIGDDDIDRMVDALAESAATVPL